MGPETVHALVGGAALGGVPAIVRVADGTAHHIAAALDAGAAGVLVPRVGSAAAAEAAAPSAMSLVRARGRPARRRARNQA